ncbi:toll/interleukin-1 receptor domain-containing protein [Tenacibaculum aiptasiae]|uniref:toll/interleukin-1 receptor domain-containing protein n=1 Tax=Tenacibaculum aiptasiae TaxID=426481 RepID=UPI00232E0B84|nr:toll/interleukin-1 receptor domain-containing protein [Tenacibaculum aiptasiae]
MKVFLSYSSQDLKFVSLLKNRLMALGHSLFLAGEDIKVGEKWNEQIKKSIEIADIFIPILTSNSVKSNWVIYEFGVFSEYVNQNSNKKTIIPIVIDNIEPPSVFANLLYLKGNRDNIDDLINRIQHSISQFEGRKIAKEEKAQKRRETIESSSADYIIETIKTLEVKEREFKTKANWWYALGYIALLLGVGVASYLTISGIGIKGEWTDIILIAVKATFVILLLLSASKYSFNLAKTYMNESLKNSDRIHAISFGKFYLQVFGNDIDKGDVKEVFREWNLEQKSNFTDLKSDDYDPKLIEIIAKTIESIKK